MSVLSEAERGGRLAVGTISVSPDVSGVASLLSQVGMLAPVAGKVGELRHNSTRASLLRGVI